MVWMEWFPFVFVCCEYSWFADFPPGLFVGWVGGLFGESKSSWWNGSPMRFFGNKGCNAKPKAFNCSIDWLFMYFSFLVIVFLIFPVQSLHIPAARQNKKQSMYAKQWKNIQNIFHPIKDATFALSGHKCALPILYSCMKLNFVTTIRPYNIDSWKKFD